MGDKIDEKIPEEVAEEVTEASETDEISVSQAQSLSEVIEELKQKYQSIKVDDYLTVTVPKDELIDFMRELKDKYVLNYLTNLTAADYPKDNKFEIVYNISSIERGYSIMVKTEVDRENPEVPSVFPVWGGANWQEREVYDLFGIVFTEHPNLKRILLYDAFEGYPLRKDFEWVGGRQ